MPTFFETFPTLFLDSTGVVRADHFGDTGIAFRPVIGLLGQAVLGSEAYITGNVAYTGIRLNGTADLLVHHIHAFTIHVTALVQRGLLRSVYTRRCSSYLKLLSTVAPRS